MNSPLATPHRWTSRDLRISHLRLLHPDSLVGTDGSGRDKTHKSNVALLLQPTLHNFNALAPVNLLDRITYGPNSEKSRKSNAALLLPHLFPVSPLLRYSYKKMGGTPLLPVFRHPACIFCHEFSVPSMSPAVQSFSVGRSVPSALNLFPLLTFTLQLSTLESHLSPKGALHV
jgi:hypothetical protein